MDKETSSSLLAICTTNMQEEATMSMNELAIREGQVTQALLQKYDATQYHVILPSYDISLPDDITTVHVSVVNISPNPKDMMVYPFPEAGKNMMAWAKSGIQAIGNAAGAKDGLSENVLYISGQIAIVRATVTITLPNGEVVPRTRSKSVDVTARMAEYKWNLRQKIEEGKECVRHSGETDENYMRRVEQYVVTRVTKRRLHLAKFMYEMADTIAHSRAMQALFPSLKPVYHINELRKPFIVPRIGIERSPASNEMLNAAISARARRDLTQLFGPEDDYSDLPPEVAMRLREHDELLARLADDYDDGTLLREAALMAPSQQRAEQPVVIR